MTLRYFYKNNAGSIVEMLNPRRVRKTGTEASSQAEEGAVGTWDLEVDDPEGTFNVRGYRIVYAQEDEAVADAQHGIIGVWYTGERYVSRMARDAPNARTGAARVWRISLHDLNVRLSWRINVGNDCRRAYETDLERIAWLMATNEMSSWLDPDTTYIDASDGIGMDSDETDYTGQTLLDVIDDCAQTSGRNYGLLWEYSGDEDDPIAIKLWYKHGTSEDYTSAKLVNNRLEELDQLIGGGVLAPSIDAELNRSPSRVAWGVYQLYDGGAVYRTLQSTSLKFNKIDVTGRGENVKTAAQATLRADHYLESVSDEETDRITCAVLVDPVDVNSILPFHRLGLHFEHLPGYGELDDYLDPVYRYMRVVERTVRDVAPGLYELGLTLMAPAADEFTEDEEAGGTFLPWRAHVQGSSGPYPLPSGPILWDDSLAEHGLPWYFTVGPFDYHDAPDRTWPRYDGIEITADCVLQDVAMHAEAIGVALGAHEPYTVTWEILLNDSVIASESVGPVYVAGASNLWGGGPTVRISNVECSAGDVLSGRLTCAPVAMAFFRTPIGINAGQNYLRITGGYFT